MTPQVPSDAFNLFFGWAPFIIGLGIYFVFYLAKRKECATPVTVTGHATGPAPTETYSCSQCGKRGPLGAMVAQDHGTAVSYVCTTCAASP
jgi:hypothetical protein